MADLIFPREWTRQEPSENPDRHALRPPIRLGDEIPADLAPAEIFEAARHSTAWRRYEQAKEEVSRAKAALDTALDTVRQTLEEYEK
jgi:hypothetical protein